ELLRHRQPLEGRRRSGGAERQPHVRLRRDDRPVRLCRERALMSITSDAKPSHASRSIVCPVGFRFGATAAKIRESGPADRKDLAAVVSDVPCASAGVFTVNRVCAAPVSYGASRLPAMGIRAIVANSGNANALVGARGAVDERAVAAAAAEALALAPEEVLTASTGAIGT